MAIVASAMGESQGVRGHWRIVIVLTLIYMYAFVDRMVLSLLVEPIRLALNASDVQISLLLGLAFAGAYCAFNIPAGHFADRVDRRILMAVASVFWAIMTVLCGSANTYMQIFLTRAGVGIAESVVSPTAFSLIRDTVPSRSRALAFSIYGMAPMLGGAVSLMGGSFLLRQASNGAFASVPYLSTLAPWQATLVIVGLLGLPLGALMFTFKEPARLKPTGAGSETILNSLVTSCKYMVANYRIYGPLLTFSAFGAMISFAKTAWFPAALGRRWGLSPAEIGPSLGAMTLVGGIAGLLVGGWIMNASIRRGGTALSYGIVGVLGTALGVTLTFAAPSLTLAYAGAQLALFFVGVSFAAAATTLGEVTPVEMMGRVSAVYLVVQTLVGQTVGPFAVAFVSETFFTGPSDLPIALSTTLIGLAIVATLAATALIRHHHKNAFQSPASATA